MNRIVLLFILLLVFCTIAVILFFQQEKFGALPTGTRLERINNSPNAIGSTFQNLEPTPDITDGHSFFSILKDRFFPLKPKQLPQFALPSQKTDLLNLNKEEDVIVWFGHSSFFLQINGKRMLVDPVLSGSASPIPSFINSFDGSDIYTVSEIPTLDFLFITHDHWDHLDYETILKLKEKVDLFVCPLGVGAHLEQWGIHPPNIIEGDWWESFQFQDDFTITFTPARHFSGRGLRRNKTLWSSFVLQTKGKKYFLSGDGGYGIHLKEIANRFGSFDFAVLENGQYNEAWKYIHMFPAQVMQTAKDLKIDLFMPIHSAKFDLANHDWFEPLDSVYRMNEKENRAMTTPLIGEKVILSSSEVPSTPWWRKFL